MICGKSKIINRGLSGRLVRGRRREDQCKIYLTVAGAMFLSTAQKTEGNTKFGFLHQEESTHNDRKYAISEASVEEGKGRGRDEIWRSEDGESSRTPS